MEKDITTKNLLENNDVFADTANVNLFGGDTVIRQEDLEEMPVETSYKDLDGAHRRLSRDILKMMPVATFVLYYGKRRWRKPLSLMDLAYYKDKKRLYARLRRDRREIIHVEQLLDMLYALSGDGRFDEIKESYINSENKEECRNMCMLLDMCEEEGMKKGMKEGISLTKKVLQMNAQGSSVDEIVRELKVKSTVIEHILS